MEGKELTPNWQTDDGSVRLYNADALTVLPTLDAVDAVITDPPFGVRAEAWDDMTDYEFARFSMRWLVLASGLSDTLVSFYASGSRFKELCEYLYPRVRPLIWHKPLGSQYAGASEAKMWFAYEPIVHCYTKDRWEIAKPKDLIVANLIREARERKGLSRGGVDMVIRGKKTGLCYRWEEAACLPTPEQTAKLKTLLGLNGELDAALEAACADRDDTLRQMADKSAGTAAAKTDVFMYRTITNGCHPCEKPVDLLADLTETLTEPGQVVCDPFMGSGTGGVAAVRLGRQYIGIEQDPEHFATAVRRIDAELNRAPLFAPPLAVQRSLALE